MADRRDGEYGRGSFGSQTGAGPGGWPAEEGAPEAPRSVGSQGKSSSEIARQIGLAMHPEELFSHNTPNLAPSPPSMPHSGNLSAPGLYHSQTRAPPQVRPLPTIRFAVFALLLIPEARRWTTS